MHLPVTLQQRIVSFFGSLPNLHDTDSQRAFIYSAGLDRQLQNQISIGKPLAQFALLLVATLVDYGKLVDGRDSLITVLETAKHSVGKDKQHECDILIGECRIFQNQHVAIKSALDLRSKSLRVRREDALNVFRLNAHMHPIEYIKNDFEDMGVVVLDHVTGLLWQKGGAVQTSIYEESQAYIEKLNCEFFGGYTGWRLPTIHELLSLTEPTIQPNGLYIDAIFDNVQQQCWSSDYN